MSLSCKRLLRLGYLLFIALGFTSCLDEFQGEEVIVLTEDLLELTSEDAILLGNLVSSTGRPSEVGFYIDVNESFESPNILVSEQTPEKGTFLSRTNNLTFGTQYFAMAYVIVAGETYFGEVISFSTPTPTIQSIEPSNGAIGNIVTIFGLNITNDSRVFFGDQEANVVSILNKNTMAVAVPDIGNEFVVPIEVVMQGSSFEIDVPFTYHTGSWQQRAEFLDDIQLRGGVTIQADDMIIFGYGGDRFSGSTINENFYLYNINSDSWSDFNAPPTGEPVADPINYGFGFGGGQSGEVPGGITQSTQSWTINQPSLEWVSNSELAITGLSSSIYANLNDADYIFGGLLPDRSVNLIIWRGDVSTGVFSPVSLSPFEITTESAFFTYDNKLFYQLDEFTIVCYDPTLDTWSTFLTTDFPLGKENMALTLNNKAYLGLGNISNFLYEIDMELGTIIRKNNFIGAGEEKSVAYWTYNEKIYVFRTGFSVASRSQGIERMTVWELDPFALKQQ